MSFPSIQSIVKKYGLLPDKNHSKRYGQNFIFDETVTQRIAAFARLPKDAFVLEVGPGPGGLTRSLLNYEPANLVAIEYDPLCVNALSYLVEAYPNFKVLQKDALNVELVRLQKSEIKKPIHIVANLPYNIGTELLVRWLHQLPLIGSMTLMFQKEVANRIQADIGNGEYGRLSVLTQNLCTVEHGFDLPPEVFTPAPKIESSVIHIRPKTEAESYLPLLPVLEQITQAAFHQRRKQVKGPLKAVFGDDTVAMLEKVDARGEMRAENLTPAQYMRLAELKRG
ncbi:MAG: 16S rRNA (adenine(1518)-N(6)/adenine(1519)-N(6))-dimethyltransferase RsmA [Candidatus Paracaedibacteraceae bacterium]|nr:16S rRNA (adenine(1518)-N(6)/adenine(1519)-N(6))-dimethyltransferase RsmA [Candidatus Paracaedibacteraceae bacterium]